MNILKEIHKELTANVDQQYKADNQRYFKEKISCYGVRTPIVRKLAKKYFKLIKDLDKKEIFALSEKLLDRGYNESATIAIQWAAALEKQFEKKDFKTFERWLKKYIDNWGKVDNLCPYLINPLILQYPELTKKVKSWAHSKNMWVRRASAVSFITTKESFYSKKRNLQDIFEVAKILMYDEEDLVQKGYGWMLKVAADHKQREVFQFVIKHKDTMPRTALRYAIEKMPARLKRQAMKRSP